MHNGLALAFDFPISGTMNWLMLLLTQASFFTVAMLLRLYD